MKELRVYFHGLGDGAPALLGRLGYGRGQRHTHFEMDPAFLRLGVNPSPLRLESRTGLQPAPMHPFEGLHGLFNDSLPDGWGRYLMDRAFRQRGLDLDGITPLHRLAAIGARAMGALSYVPDAHGSDGQAAPLDLPAIGLEATRQYLGDASEILDSLVRHASPSGGARPKILVGIREADGSAVTGADDLPEGHSHWLAKFPTGMSATDRSAGAIEYLYSRIARTAGIKMAETRLIPGQKGNAYFITRRFDRSAGNPRRHIHSVAGLVHSNFRMPDFDYLDLLKLSDWLTRSHAEKTELFRRMVFNVVGGNRDDHSKNFAFEMKPGGEWINAPAYDLTYNTGLAGHHSMTIQGKGRGLVRDDLLKLAHTSSIPRSAAKRILDEVCDAFSAWAKDAPAFPIPKEQASDIQRHIERQRSRLLPPSA
ncbi:MAG: type II toxin-antitoxin system HipA family toxin [Gammaproteobacteria bacterium]|nr:type II toxin-antitoxin system HipA family toxin [Gammaproteobacteria bacterium]